MTVMTNRALISAGGRVSTRLFAGARKLTESNLKGVTWPKFSAFNLPTDVPSVEGNCWPLKPTTTWLHPSAQRCRRGYVGKRSGIEFSTATRLRLLCEWRTILLHRCHQPDAETP